MLLGGFAVLVKTGRMTGERGKHAAPFARASFGGMGWCHMLKSVGMVRSVFLGLTWMHWISVSG